MNPSRIAPVALALLLAACGGGGPRGPHLIVISVDTLRRDALAAYGGSGGPLPALDRLAAESVRCENAFSSAPWTLPAHASLLTGLYPDRHGATDRRVTLAGDVETLAGLLARRGYETAAFTGGGFLDAEYGLGRGFERYEAKAHAKQESAETAASLLARVERYLAARTKSSPERPLFLFLHTYAVHNYADARPEAVAHGALADAASRKQYVDCVLGRAACPSGAWDELAQLYRAELELLDDVFARLRAALEDAGLWQGAYVVLLSDHGEGFEPERARIHHGGRLHDDQLRIPLLVRGPDLAPRAETLPVSIVDLMPTLLELARADAPPGLDGRSFATLLRGGTAPPSRPLLAMDHYFGWADGRRVTSPDVLALPRALAVIDGERWYITGEAPDELYAVADDGQRAPLPLDDARTAELRASIGERPLARAESSPAVKDEELENALDALGYGGDGE